MYLNTKLPPYQGQRSTPCLLPEAVHHCLDHGLGTAVAEEAAAVPASEAAGAAAVAGGARQAVADAELAAVAASLW